MLVRSLATIVAAVVFLVPRGASAATAVTLEAPYMYASSWTICDIGNDAFGWVHIGVCEPSARAYGTAGTIDLGAQVSGTRTATAHGSIGQEVTLDREVDRAFIVAHVRLEGVRRAPRDSIVFSFGAMDPACACGDVNTYVIDAATLAVPDEITIELEFDGPMEAGSYVGMELQVQLDARGAERLRAHTASVHVEVEGFEVTLI